MVVDHTVPADGQSTATISVRIRNEDGKPLANYPVQLLISGSQNTLTPAAGETNAQGVFTATLASTKAERKTITAIIPGSHNLTVSVIFTAARCTGTLLLPSVPQAGPVGVSPQSATTADVNGDGKPDLAVANGGSYNVSVLLGNGNGTFQAAVNYPVGSSPRSVTTGDVNEN
jgi:hypothetical protein